jgi:hypothetical protein
MHKPVFIYNNTANAFFYKGNLVSGRNVTQAVASTNENRLTLVKYQAASWRKVIS